MLRVRTAELPEKDPEIIQVQAVFKSIEPPNTQVQGVTTDSIETRNTVRLEVS